MAVNHNSEEGIEIRKRIPLNTIPGLHFEKLCKYLTVEKQPKGYQLFSRGDESEDLIYLLKGEVTLKSDGFKIETINSDSELSNFALAHQIPRKIGATANNAISFLRIPPSVIKKLQESSSNTDHSQMIVEPEEEVSGDWMTRLLKSPIFQLLPAANLQKILMSLKEVDIKAGKVITEQGEYPGEFYYIIKNGKCSVTRKPSENAKSIILGKLSVGHTFGEASILADKPIDRTVTALTDVTLLKLTADDFLKLIRNPSLTFTNSSTIRQELDNGALLIDIRSADEFQQYQIDGSINIPYFSIKVAAKTIDKNRKIMIICEDGKLSEAAAFDLIDSKLTVAIVEGGLKKARPKEQRYKANFAIDDNEPDQTEALGGQPISEDDLDSAVEQEAPENPVIANSEPAVDQDNQETIEFDALNQAVENNTQPSNLIEGNFSQNNTQDRTLLEAKIQLLRDENRELMKANMQLENQYNDLLQQKEALEKQLQELQKG